MEIEATGKKKVSFKPESSPKRKEGQGHTEVLESPRGDRRKVGSAQ